MEKVKIIFTKCPAGEFRLAYFVDDVATIEKKQADLIMKSGYAVPFESEAGDASDLPANIPARHILVDYGIDLEQLKQFGDLSEIPGVGKATASKIRAFLDSFS